MTDKTQLAADYAKQYFNFLCLLNEEGELVAAFMNFKPVTEGYTKTAEDILQSGADNTIMVFRDISEGSITGALHHSGLEKTYMVTLNTDEMVQTFPWWLMDEGDE